MQQLPLFLRKTLAWSMYLFTITGAVQGFLILRAVFAMIVARLLLLMAGQNMMG